MFLLSIDLPWIILLLVIVNLAGVNILSGEDRFWLPPIVLWIFTFFLFILIRQFNLDEVAYQEALFERTAGIDPNNDFLKMEAIKNLQGLNGAFNKRMLNILGIQALLATLSQVYGYQKTGQRYYRSALITFSILSLLYLALLLLFFQR